MSAVGPAPTTAPVKLLKRSADDRSWDSETSDVHTLCDRYGPSVQLSPAKNEAFVFLKDETLTQSLKERLSRCFSIPELFWESYYQKSNGFFRSEELFDVNLKLRGIVTWFKILVKQVYAPKDTLPGKKNYRWDENIFFSITLNNTFTVMLCFDVADEYDEEEKFRLKVENRAKSGAATTSLPFPTTLHQMYKWHVLLFEVYITLYDDSVWLITKRIRAFETDRKKHTKAPDFSLLHDIGRHAIHSTESLTVAVDVMELALTRYRSLLELDKEETQTQMGLELRKELIARRQIEHKMESQIQSIKAINLRSQATEGRLQGEINLAYNVVSQKDSNATVLLSQAAFIFLPPTFICAVFSTTFFAFASPGGNQSPVWQMSDDFWILWVVIVPVTIFAYLIRPQGRGGKFFRPTAKLVKDRVRFRRHPDDEIELGNKRGGD